MAGPVNLLRGEAVAPALSALIVVIFFALLILFSTNIPQQDDFDAIFVYLLRSQDSVLNGLFDVHVSHRLVVTRLLARLSLLSGYGVDLRLLMFTGALSLVGVLVLIYRSLGGALGQRQFLLLILCLSLFSLFHWSNLTWATASVQNYLVLFVAVAALRLSAGQSATARAVAALLGMLAPYINSAGLLVLPLLALQRLVAGGSARQTLAGVMVLVLLSVASLVVFLQVLPGRTDGSALLPDALPAAADLVWILRAYLITCAGFLHFELLAMIGGMCVNAYFVLLVWFGYHKLNPLVFFTCLFLLLALLIVAIFRHEMGTDFLIASRYQVFTLLIVALIGISCIELELSRFIPVDHFRAVMLASFVLLYLSSFYYLGNLHSERDRLRQGLESWHATRAPTLYHPRPQVVGEILEQTINAGIYHPPGHLR